MCEASLHGRPFCQCNALTTTERWRNNGLQKAARVGYLLRKQRFAETKWTASGRREVGQKRDSSVRLGKKKKNASSRPALRATTVCCVHVKTLSLFKTELNLFFSRPSRKALLAARGTHSAVRGPWSSWHDASLSPSSLSCE